MEASFNFIKSLQAISRERDILTVDKKYATYLQERERTKEHGMNDVELRLPAKVLETIHADLDSDGNEVIDGPFNLPSIIQEHDDNMTQSRKRMKIEGKGGPRLCSGGRRLGACHVFY